jgi:hypothetical protein
MEKGEGGGKQKVTYIRNEYRQSIWYAFMEISQWACTINVY